MQGALGVREIILSKTPRTLRDCLSLQDLPRTFV
jgi:hypothetical protein